MSGKIQNREGANITLQSSRYGDITGLDEANFSLPNKEAFQIINEDEENITLSVKYPGATEFQNRVFFSETESPLIVEEIEANEALTDGSYKLAYC